MSVPDGFDSFSKYFESVLHFLKQYSWIYNTSNTDFVKEGVLEKFPLEWKEYFENISNEALNLFAENRNQDNRPESIVKFQNTLQSLQPKKEIYCDDTQILSFQKMSLKKSHEISMFSKKVLEICKDEVDILIDFGSGLGYLSQILSQNYKIIGLECDANRVQKATDRMMQYYPSSKDQIFYLEQFITESSTDFILDNVKKLFPNIQAPRIGIIGLHSCADLTITSMKLFFDMENVKKLIIMPCCYHKLDMREDSNSTLQYFHNFPLSNDLKMIFQDFEDSNIFNRPFLRLACQQTLSRWRVMNEDEHFLHGQEMFIRGVTEAILKNGEVLKINKINKIRVKEKLAAEINFDNVQEMYEIKGGLFSVDHKNKFVNITEKYIKGWKLTEGLTCLQTSMQELCENIVLCDRISFMDEQGKYRNVKTSCRFEKILDDKLSPRCFALIANKY